MNPWKFVTRAVMKRRDGESEGETDTDTADEDDTESDESATDRKSHFLGLSFYKLSYKRLPKKCIQFSFLSLNGGIFLAGITATIISLWMLADNQLTSRLIGQKLFVTILLFIGIYSSSVSSIGILAFLKRRKKFLIIYIMCHSLSLCVIFICAIMSFTFFEQLTNKVRHDMVNSMVNYRLLDWATEAWDNTHKYLECCGIKSVGDWDEYRTSIPQSCCAVSIDKCLHMSKDVAYKSGCLKSVIFLLKSHIHTVALSSLFISVILATSLFFALGIQKRFRTYRSGSV